MRVLKFGGASLRDGEAIRRAAGIVRAHVDEGDRLLVVVSAHEGVTTLLERTAEEAERGRLDWDPVRIRHRTILRELGLSSELLDRHLRELRAILEHVLNGAELERRRRDFVLSFGERMSARVVAETLRREGVAATPVDAFDLGLLSETRAGLTLPLESARERVRAAVMQVPGVPVVTGFIALDTAGHVTTLGRNGSDLTAVWMGEAVDAEEVELIKTVDGVMTADPRLVPAARRIDRLSYAEAAELAAHGAGILHPAAMEPAERRGIPVRIRNAEKPNEPGTRIDAGEGRPDGPIGIAHRSRISVHGLASFALVGPGVGSDAELVSEVLALTRDAGLDVSPSPTDEGPTSRVFLTPTETLGDALRAVHRAWFERGGALPRRTSFG
ncbi:MAG: aspartate kinase [Planctomycetota bacterium]|nr:aspartate kinase [Planctomycetota bacterium]